MYSFRIYFSAANILSLLSSTQPKVLIVEEAGECLESHVLVNLVPSIEHTILIGDHLQLRPQISSYGKLLFWLGFSKVY